MGKIFISHSSANKQVGEALIRFLVEVGVKKEDVFFTSNFETSGINNFSEIRQALDKSTLFIGIISKEYIIREYCMQELGIMWYKKMPCMLILADDLDVKQITGFFDGEIILNHLNADLLRKLLMLLKNYDFINTDLGIHRFYEVCNHFLSNSGVINDKMLNLMKKHHTLHCDLTNEQDRLIYGKICSLMNLENIWTWEFLIYYLTCFPTKIVDIEPYDKNTYITQYMRYNNTKSISMDEETASIEYSLAIEDLVSSEAIYKDGHCDQCNKDLYVFDQALLTKLIELNKNDVIYEYYKILKGE